MKKLYRKGTVHPSPPPPPPPQPIISDDRLSVLPAAIFALAAALSPGDREVLAYLLLCSNSNSSSSAKKSSSSTTSPGSGSAGDHSPEFGCDCFRCYTTYWVRWGSSPDRQLIHDIIEAFEEHQHNHNHNHHHNQSKGKAKNGKRERRNNSKHRGGITAELKRSESASPVASGEASSADLDSAVQGGGERGEGREVEETSPEKGSNVRRFVSFVGERIWGVWG